jgi:hypothetical protein
MLLSTSPRGGMKKTIVALPLLPPPPPALWERGESGDRIKAAIHIIGVSTMAPPLRPRHSRTLATGRRKDIHARA